MDRKPARHVSALPITLRAALPAALLVSLLAGCNAPPGASPPAQAPAAPASTPPIASDSPAPAPSDTPPAAATDAGEGPARLDGFGALRLGMRADEMRKAWTGGLVGALPEGEIPEACYFLEPAGQKVRPGVAFMMEGGRFVRYGVYVPDVAAPGGGRVGMREAELRALYGNALQSAPHEYDPKGKYLSLPPAGGTGAKLLFELTGEGVVQQWRVGVPPQVDYVEGCA